MIILSLLLHCEGRTCPVSRHSWAGRHRFFGFEQHCLPLNERGKRLVSFGEGKPSGCPSKMLGLYTNLKFVEPLF